MFLFLLQKKCCKYKIEKIEIIKFVDLLYFIVNGDIKGRKFFTNQRDFFNMGEVYYFFYKGFSFEGSSEILLQLEEFYFCGILVCISLCNGQI